MREDENLLIPRYGIPTHWTPEAEREAENLNRIFNVSFFNEYSEGYDRAPYVFPLIVKPHEDIDDALSVEISGTSCQVGIHIADVAQHIVSRKPALIKKPLKEQPLSTFLKVRFPCCPPLLSEGIFSLTEGQHRLAISVIIHFDSSYEIKNFAILPSIVKVNRRYSYIQSDEQIESDDNLVISPAIHSALKGTEAPGRCPFSSPA